MNDPGHDTAPVAGTRIGPSRIHGLGLFAVQSFEAGDRIGFYAGPQVEQDGMHVLWIEQDDGSWAGYDGTGALRFLNHSERPNAAFDDRDCFALRRIEAGEEITIDYGWDESDDERDVKDGEEAADLHWDEGETLR